MTTIRRISSLALVAVVALLVGLPFLAFAQSTPSIPFAPSSSGGSGGGGCPGPSCDAEYLRLDATNDPMLAPLAVDDGDATNPGVNFGTGVGAYYTATDPYFGGTGLVVGEGLTTAGARGTLFTHFAGVDYTVSERFEAVGPTSATFSDYSFSSILTDCADAATCAFGILVENSVTTDFRLQLVTSSSKAALFDDDATTTPNISFEDDTDSGFGRTAANTLAMYAGGSDVFAFTTTNAQTLNVRPKTDNVSDLGSGSFKYANAYIGTVIADKVEADPGTVGAPTLTFGTDNTSGLYLASSGIPAMSASGNLTTAWGLDHRSTTLDGMTAVGFVAAPVFDYGNANVTATPSAPAACSAAIEGFTLYARDTDLATNNGALCLCTCASVVANACDSWGWRLADGTAARVCDLL